MPPAVSSDEASSSESEQIPYRKKEDTVAGGDQEDGEEDIDDEDGDPDEYVVEKICGHQFDAGGQLIYEVKWLGYEKKSDRTWEPESNLEGAQEVLEEYYSSIGGKPQQRKENGAGTKRKLSKGAADTPLNSKGKGRKRGRADEDTPKNVKKAWVPPEGSWENDVNNIDAVEEHPNETTGEKERFAYIMWNNGKKTYHPLSVINKKCPQKMLRYYEQHLVFKMHDPSDAPGAPK